MGKAQRHQLQIHERFAMYPKYPKLITGIFYPIHRLVSLAVHRPPAQGKADQQAGCHVAPDREEQETNDCFNHDPSPA